MKKIQKEAALEMDNLGKRSGVTDASIYHRKHKENTKCKKLLTQNIQEIQDTMKWSNLRIIGIEEDEDSPLKGPEIIFSKIIEENFANIKR